MALSFYIVKSSSKEQDFSALKRFYLLTLIYHLCIASIIDALQLLHDAPHQPFKRKIKLHHPDILFVNTVFPVLEILVFCGILSEALSLFENKRQEGPKQLRFSYFMEGLHVRLLLNSEVQVSRNESISSYLNMVKYGNSVQS